MTTETPVAGAAAAPAAAAAATAAAAAPSSGGAAAPAGATPAATTAKADGTAQAASAGEAGKRPAGGFMDEPVDPAAAAAAAAAASAAVEAFAKVEGDDARKAAYAALSDADKATAAAALDDAGRAALGIEKAAAADGAITYTDFKMPDGVTIDGPLMDKAKAKFVEQGLSQDQAQAMVDFYAGDIGKMVQEVAQKPYDLWRDTQNTWIDEVHADPEIGGAKLQVAKANAAKAIDALCSPEEAKALRETLKWTGVTNNPAIFRFMSRVGAKISEGRYVGGDPPAATPKQQHEIMYPTTVKAAE